MVSQSNFIVAAQNRGVTFFTHDFDRRTGKRLNRPCQPYGIMKINPDQIDFVKNQGFMHPSWKAATIVLCLLCLLAAGIRLYRLGDMDTRGDEVELLIPPIANFGPLENFIRDFQVFKTGRILGLPRMTASALVKGLGLETNRTNIRLAYALIGILTIPALFLLGLRLGDRRLAWILAFLGVINPCLIFYSRQAHIYAFPLLFNTLAAAWAAAVVRSLMARQLPRAIDLVYFAAASILACHSHMSSWPFIGLLWVLVFLILWMRRDTPVAKQAVRGVGIAFGVWILALLPWIFMFISALFTAKGSFIQGGVGAHVFSAMWRLPFVMTWGGGLPWGGLTVGLISAGALLGLYSPRWRGVVGVTLIVGMIIFGMMSVMMQIGGQFFNLRYYLPLWLVFNLLGGIGVLLLAEWSAAGLQRAGWKKVQAGYVAAGFCGVVACFMALPIYWILHLPGNPTPYTLINRWMDTHLPQGTLVIVDRWFEPWNEMRYHAPTNVYATFTVPSEPQDTLLKFNWPQTIKDFYREYPNAAYLDMVRTSPVAGQVWEWPRWHFHRHVAITNEQALALRRAVLAPEDGYYFPHTSRIIVDIFYNTREDVVNQARAAGMKNLVLYGSEWGYVKLWQQLRDFRDWRTLEDQAALDVYNLTSQTNVVNITIRGMAINGSKRVVGPCLWQDKPAGATHDFKHLQLEEWPVGQFVLHPGLNQLVLKDPFWKIGHIPLLVDEVRVVEEEDRGPDDQGDRGPDG